MTEWEIAMTLQALELLSVSTHPSKDVLEEYAMGIMPVTDQAHLEYHVLVCAECCEELEETFQFVEAFKHSLTDAGPGTE
jgi:hypothetical protein